MANTQKNIVLVGFMGTGKSSVGRRLAERLKMRFADMDDGIVDRAGKSIPRIFAEDGEVAFRTLERALVQELAAQSGLVIATGGGVVLNPDNLRDFEASGLVVCLSATPDAILERLKYDTTRPLLSSGDKFEKISGLLATRQALYEAVPLRIDTTALSHDAVVQRILDHYAGD